MDTCRVIISSFLVVGALPAREYIVDAAARSAGEGTSRRPFASIAKAVTAARAGDTITVRPGIYRESIRITQKATARRPLTLRASGKAPVVITGTDIVTGWKKSAGQVWVKQPWTTAWCEWSVTMSHGADPPVGRCEQVVYNGTILKQVMDRTVMRAGTFHADPKESRTLAVWLPDGANPESRPVEVALRNSLVTIEGNHIHVSGLTMRYAANHAQHGAVAVTGSDNTLSDCTVEWTNGTGLTFRGTRLTFRRVTCRYNGQLGMGGGGVDCVFSDCALINNNVKGFPAGWEAGGIKVVRALRTSILRMAAVGNGGPGIWYDIDNRACTVAECWAEKNAGSGIFIEISGRMGMEIRDNVCVDNGTGKDWGASGISLGESMNCRVHNNLCVRNPTGIGIRELGPRTFRGPEDGEDVTYYSKGHTIYNNICAYNTQYQFGLWYDNVFFGPHPSPEVGTSGTALDPARSGLRLHHNLYWPGEGHGLILWGCPWRSKHKTYQDLRTFRRAHRLETGSIVADPQLLDPQRGDVRLKPSSPALKATGGRKGPAHIKRPDAVRAPR